MDKKLPKVFANKVDEKSGNNESIYYSHSKDDSLERGYTPVKGKNVNQKINEIFNSSNYVYKADVKITLKDGVITKRIVGRNATHLITIDNELIPLTDIKDIERKNS